jgi:hypothetical protein
MSLKARLRTVLCCAVLEMGALLGMPMRPKDILELLEALNVPKAAEEDPLSQAEGDGYNPPGHERPD